MLSSKDIEYMSYTLGDIGVIELLLSYRYKYDDYLFYDDRKSKMTVSGAGRIVEEVLATYVALDEYIKNCNLSENQLELLRLIGEGYTYEEIAFEMNTRLSTISGKLKTVYKKIYKENERDWRKFSYIHKLGLKNKTCSKCEEELPATSEFFSDLDRTKDGFHSQCRKCKK